MLSRTKSLSKLFISLAIIAALIVIGLTFVTLHSHNHNTIAQESHHSSGDSWSSKAKLNQWNHVIGADLAKKGEQGGGKITSQSARSKLVPSVSHGESEGFHDHHSEFASKQLKKQETELRPTAAATPEHHKTAGPVITPAPPPSVTSAPTTTSEAITESPTHKASWAPSVSPAPSDPELHEEHSPKTHPGTTGDGKKSTAEPSNGVKDVLNLATKAKSKALKDTLKDRAKSKAQKDILNLTTKAELHTPEHIINPKFVEQYHKEMDLYEILGNREALALRDSQPGEEAFITHISASHYAFPAIPYMFHSPHHAVDENLESWAEVVPSRAGEHACFGFRLNDMIWYDWNWKEKDVALESMRIFLPRDGTERHNGLYEGIEISLYHHENGDAVRISPPLYSDGQPVLVWNFTHDTENLDRQVHFDTFIIRSHVPGVPLRIAEIQLVPRSGVPRRFRFKKDAFETIFLNGRLFNNEGVRKYFLVVGNQPMTDLQENEGKNRSMLEGKSSINSEVKQSLQHLEDDIETLFRTLTYRTYICPDGKFTGKVEERKEIPFLGDEKQRRQALRYICKPKQTEESVLIAATRQEMGTFPAELTSRFNAKTRIITQVQGNTAAKQLERDGATTELHGDDHHLYSLLKAATRNKEVDFLYIARSDSSIDTIEQLEKGSESIHQAVLDLALPSPKKFKKMILSSSVKPEEKLAKILEFRNTVQTFSKALEQLKQKYHITSSIVLERVREGKKTLVPFAASFPFRFPLSHRISLISRSHLEKTDCAWIHGHKIPPVMYSIWKTKNLFQESQEMKMDWEIKEPCLKQELLTDADCHEMAGKVSPAFLQVYDSMPVNVMRGDTCRVLAIYFHSGMYRDLDVSWKTSLRSWLDLDKDILIGNETADGRVCNWFFYFTKENPCIRKFFDNLVESFPNATYQGMVDYMRGKHSHVESVFNITGPIAFSHVTLACAKPNLTWEEITEKKIKHNFGSQRWRNKKYVSWVMDLTRKLGQKYGDKYLTQEVRGFLYGSEDQVLYGVYPKPLSEAAISTTKGGNKPNSKHLLETAFIDDVTLSINAFPSYAPDYFGAHHAVDGELDTYADSGNIPLAPPPPTPPSEEKGKDSKVDTSRHPQAVLQVHLQHPLPIHSLTTGSSSVDAHSQLEHQPVVSGIKILANRDNKDNEDFPYVSALSISISDEHGEVMGEFNFTRPKDAKNLAIIQWNLPKALSKRELQSVTIRRPPGERLRIGEVQLLDSNGQAIELLFTGEFIEQITNPLSRQFPKPSKELYKKMGFEHDPDSNVIVIGEQERETAWEKYLSAGVRLTRTLTARSHHCPQGRPIGDLYEHGMWYLCEKKFKAPCNVLSVGRTTDNNLDLEQILAAEYGCNVAVMDPYTNYEWDSHFEGREQNITNMKFYQLGIGPRHDRWKRRSIPELMKIVNMTHINLLRFDDEGVEWDMIDDLVNAAEKKLVDEVSFEVHIWGPPTQSPRGTVEWAQRMERIRQHWDLVASRPSRHAGLEPIPAPFPCCHKVSLVRKDVVLQQEEEYRKLRCPVYPAKALPRKMVAVDVSEDVNPKAYHIMKLWKVYEPCFAHVIFSRSDCMRAAGSLGKMREHMKDLPDFVLEPICFALAMYDHAGFVRRYDLAPLRSIEDEVNWDSEVLLVKRNGHTLHEMAAVSTSLISTSTKLIQVIEKMKEYLNKHKVEFAQVGAEPFVFQDAREKLRKMLFKDLEKEEKGTHFWIHDDDPENHLFEILEN